MWVKAIQSATAKQGDEVGEINMMKEFSKEFVCTYGVMVVFWKKEDQKSCSMLLL